MKRPLKIFVDGHCFDKEHQGTKTFVRELYRAMINNHPDIEVYIGAFDIGSVRKTFPQLEASRILPYKSAGIRRIFFDIPKLIKQHQFDFAHFQYISPSKIKGCKYIVTAHDLLYKEMPEYFSSFYIRLRDYFFKRSFVKADIKTTISEYSRKSITKFYAVQPEQIHILPNAVSSDFAKGFVSEREANLKIKSRYGISDFILYVSRIEPRKNHKLLLKAYIELELYKKNIPLVFIGHASIPVPALQAMLASLDPIQQRAVYILNHIDDDELVAFYRSCRLFVYPSLGEGFGIPPLEAAACGAPVLCSNNAALSAFNFFEPYTFDPMDEKDFKDKLQDMIMNPVSDNFIESVSNEIASHYSWEKSAEHLYQLMQKSALQ